MPFGRRRAAHRSRETKARDPFDHLADERRAAESDAWFMRPDDAPPLEVQAGVSSNLSDDDLADQRATAGDQDDDADGAGDNVDADAH
jgi:hypothetical protein